MADPDAVTLDIDQDTLDGQLRSLEQAVTAALRQHPDKRAQLTWRLL